LPPWPASVPPIAASAQDAHLGPRTMTPRVPGMYPGVYHQALQCTGALGAWWHPEGWRARNGTIKCAISVPPSVRRAPGVYHQIQPPPVPPSVPKVYRKWRTVPWEVYPGRWHHKLACRCTANCTTSATGVLPVPPGTFSGLVTPSAWGNPGVTWSRSAPSVPPNCPGCTHQNRVATLKCIRWLQMYDACTAWSVLRCYTRLIAWWRGKYYRTKCTTDVPANCTAKLAHHRTPVAAWGAHQCTTRVFTKIVPAVPPIGRHQVPPVYLPNWRRKGG
jgi:hypothetical protein